MRVKKMAKITIVLSNELEERLRDYIRMKYKRPFGKLSGFIEEAIEKELKRLTVEEETAKRSKKEENRH